jgi:hypothetical protein
MAALKGAFIDIGLGLLGVLANIIVFQFNPDSISRTPSLVYPPSQDKSSGSKDASQQGGSGEPSESISFSLRIDATDQLVLEGNPVAAARGIYPTLSALELLMIPKRSPSLDLHRLIGKASPTNQPTKVPIVLFVWGAFRILPVSINSLSITETQFDTLLNPVRAEVSVSLQVLTPGQLNSAFASGAYQYTQGVKEVMAALNLVNAAEIGVSSILSFSL